METHAFDEVFLDVVDVFFIVGRQHNVEDAGAFGGEDLLLDTAHWQQCFSWYDDDNTTAAKVVDKDALSEEDKQKMEDAINDAFSDIIGNYTFYDN